MSVFESGKSIGGDSSLQPAGAAARGVSATRTSSKGQAVGNLADQRRVREGKAVQLRRERRVYRIAIQRRKVESYVIQPLRQSLIIPYSQR